MSENNENKFNIELSDEIADGIYSNLAIISHSATEFIVDFITMVPGRAKGKIRSRVILTPQHAKRLMNALQDNMQKYEAKFGKVVDQAGIDQFSIPFNGPAGQA